MKPCDCALWVFHAVRFISTLREVENHCLAKIIQNFSTLSSEILTKQDSNSLHFSFFIFSPFWWKTITHSASHPKSTLEWVHVTFSKRKHLLLSIEFRWSGQPVRIFQLLTNSCRPGLTRLVLYIKQKIGKLPCSFGPSVPTRPLLGQPFCQS